MTAETLAQLTAVAAVARTEAGTVGLPLDMPQEGEGECSMCEKTVEVLILNQDGECATVECVECGWQFNQVTA